jgi:kynurenine formamidase
VAGHALAANPQRDAAPELMQICWGISGRSVQLGPQHKSSNHVIHHLNSNEFKRECQMISSRTQHSSTIRYIDLSHAIENGTVTYPGDPAASISVKLDRETAAHANGDGDFAGCEINEFTIVSTSGTYIDAPYHVFADGHKVKDYPIEKLVNLPAVVVSMAAERHYFDIEDIEKVDVNGKAILFYSGHDQFFMTPQYGEHAPFITPELARLLVERGAAFVGIDGPLVDDMARQFDQGCPVHYALLGAGIPICEDMTNLGSLPRDGFIITALPPAVSIESFPARVFATIDE